MTNQEIFHSVDHEVQPHFACLGNNIQAAATFRIIKKNATKNLINKLYKLIFFLPFLNWMPGEKSSMSFIISFMLEG